MVSLPEAYEAYLNHLERNGQSGHRHRKNVMRVLSAFHHYLSTSKVTLSSIRIGDIDTFLIELSRSVAPATHKFYRLCIRRFMKYLYSECGILDRDISLLLENGHSLPPVIPPRFLHGYEIRRLFEAVEFSSPRDLRSYAILHLAYMLGLSPREISMVTLDDIHFAESEICLPYRRSMSDCRLPLSEDTIKAIAIYVVSARPESKHRALFLKHIPPYAPISPSNVSGDVHRIMKKADLGASTRWLRNTYARGLLRVGASFFEIKEIDIRSSIRYRQIYTEHVRRVLFDEKI